MTLLNITRPMSKEEIITGLAAQGVPIQTISRRSRCAESYVIAVLQRWRSSQRSDGDMPKGVDERDELHVARLMRTGGFEWREHVNGVVVRRRLTAWAA